MTDPDAYGLHPAGILTFYIVSTTLLYLCVVLVVLTWAEALNDRSLVVNSSWLGHYRWIFYLIVAERVLLHLPLSIFAVLDINGTYLALFRATVADWAVALLGLGAFAGYYGHQLRVKLGYMHMREAAARVRANGGFTKNFPHPNLVYSVSQIGRIHILFTSSAIFGGVFCAVQVGIQHFCERYPVAWFVIFPGYHLTCLAVSSYFIVSNPGKRDFVKHQSSEALSGTRQTISMSRTSNASSAAAKSPVSSPPPQSRS